MKIGKTIQKSLFSSIFLSLSIFACSSEDADSPASVELEAGTELASAYPGSLALSVFPQSVDSASLYLTADEKEKTVKGKITEAKERLAGTADKCMDMDIFKGRTTSNFSCYDFDSDMNPTEYTQNNGNAFKKGTTNGTVAGSIDNSGSGNNEACMVAFARSQVDESVERIEQALALVSGMLCQAKKNGSDNGLPASGSTLDLSSALTTAASSEDAQKKISITSATISQLTGEDDSKYYRSDIEITMPDQSKMEVHLVHSPGENETGRGVLFTKRSGVTAGGNQGGGLIDNNNTANKNFVMSIQYDRTVEEDNSNRMRFEVRRAALVNTVEPFTDAGLVNYGGVGDDAQNSDIHAINYVAFDMDVDTNVGNLSYWMNPGGNINESARGFLFKVEKDVDGALKGCGVSGAANQMSIRKALVTSEDPTLLKPSTYWHPMGNNNTSGSCNTSAYPCQGNGKANSGSTITKQCFKQGADGVYAIANVTDTTRGYDVIATTANTVEPPTPPKTRAKGKFKKQ